MPPDDTTTIRIFDKLDELAKTANETHTSVEVIKVTMVDSKQLKAAISGCRANPPRTSVAPGKINKRFTAVILGSVAALTATVLALTKLVEAFLLSQ